MRFYGVYIYLAHANAIESQPINVQLCPFFALGRCYFLHIDPLCCYKGYEMTPVSRGFNITEP